jgi:tetraacyldisaccharide 4'-kinase
VTSLLFAPLSAAYGAAVAARGALYRIGWLRSETAPVPVISVGNIVAGGTGKTPVVALVARLLKKAGLSPAILSRGYGGRRNEDPLVVSDGSGSGPATTSAMAGDEPLMLARLLPDVPIVVARRRIEGARLAASRLGARCLVLDDGFQHIALKRNLDIVLLDAMSPLDDGRLLPAGMLREPPSALARAGALAFTGRRGSDAEAVSLSGGMAADVRADRARVAVWAPAGTPLFQIDLEPTVIVSAREPVAGVTTAPESLTASWLAGMRRW